MELIIGLCYMDSDTGLYRTVDSYHDTAAVALSIIPCRKVGSTCSNMALHDISKAGITEAYKLDFNISCVWVAHTKRSKFPDLFSEALVSSSKTDPVIKIIKQKLQ